MQETFENQTPAVDGESMVLDLRELDILAVLQAAVVPVVHAKICQLVNEQRQKYRRGILSLTVVREVLIGLRDKNLVKSTGRDGKRPALYSLITDLQPDILERIAKNSSVSD